MTPEKDRPSSVGTNSRVPGNRLYNPRNKLSSKKDFSHRISHYHKDSNSGKQSDAVEDNSLTDIASHIESDTVTQTTPSQMTPAIVVKPKEYTSLKKLSKRNEHTSQVRRTQNAAIKIQRMWRRHSRHNKSRQS